MPSFVAACVVGSDIVGVVEDSTTCEDDVVRHSADDDVVVGADDDVVVENTFVGAVVVVIGGWTSGGSTCMTIANCLEHVLVVPSVTTMTTGHEPTGSRDTDDDIRQVVESMSKIARRPISVPTPMLHVTLLLSPKSSPDTSI